MIYFITRVSKSLFNFISTIISGGGFFRISGSFQITSLFQDHEEEESGDPRVGFIQLNSGSTSFNTTLNLTGPILLGLGIAAATLFYAYFNAFNG